MYLYYSNTHIIILICVRIFKVLIFCLGKGKIEVWWIFTWSKPPDSTIYWCVCGKITRIRRRQTLSAETVGAPVTPRLFCAPVSFSGIFPTWSSSPSSLETREVEFVAGAPPSDLRVCASDRMRFHARIWCAARSFWPWVGWTKVTFITGGRTRFQPWRSNLERFCCISLAVFQGLVKTSTLPCILYIARTLTTLSRYTINVCLCVNETQWLLYREFHFGTHLKNIYINTIMKFTDRF